MRVNTTAIEITNNDGDVISIRKNEDGPGIIFSIDGSEWWVELENVGRFTEAIAAFIAGMDE